MYSLDYLWHEVIMMCLFLVQVTVVGLLAIWAALGRGRWFVRVAVVGVVLAPLLLIPAYDFLVMPVVQLLMTIPILVIARGFREYAENQSVWQFGLRDLLLLMLVVAVLSAVAAIAPRETWNSHHLMILSMTGGGWTPSPSVPGWVYTLSFSLTISVTTCLSAWVVLGRCRRWIRVALFFGVLLGVGFITFILEWMFRPSVSQPSMTVGNYLGSRSLPIMSFVEILVLYSLVALIFWVLWLWLFQTSRIREGRAVEVDLTNKRRRARWFTLTGLVVLSLMLLAPLGWFYGIALVKPVVPQTVLPDPNGYTQLVELGKQLEKITVPDDVPAHPSIQPAKPQDFLDFEQKYRVLLAKVHESLDLPSLVPVKYDLPDLDDSPGYLRQLARALNASAKAAFIRGDTEQVVRYNLDNIRLGQACIRGGLCTDWFTGMAVEGMGKYSIHEKRITLASDVRKNIIAKLDVFEKNEEPMEAIRQREEIWSQIALGWMGRFSFHIDKFSGNNDSHAKMMQDAEMHDQALYRILQVELALENYHDTHGKYPDRLKQLVPDELKELPLDPFNNKPLCYRLSTKGYLVYSVGPDGQDDSGETYDSNDPYIDDVRFE